VKFTTDIEMCLEFVLPKALPTARWRLQATVKVAVAPVENTDRLCRTGGPVSGRYEKLRFAGGDRERRRTSLYDGATKNLRRRKAEPGWCCQKHVSI